MIFYRLRKEMADFLIENLETYSEWKVWCYLATFDPFGHKYIELPPLINILMKCKISERTFYRVIAKLKELELFDFQYDKAFIRNLSNKNYNDTDYDDTDDNPETKAITGLARPDSLTAIRDSDTAIHDSKTDTRDSDDDTRDSASIYQEFKNSKISLESNAHEEKKAIASLERAIATDSATTMPTFSVIPEIESDSPVKTEFSQGEKFSAVVSAPEKPKPKPRPRIESESWPPAGPWNINGQLDMNFRDAIAQSWVVAYGGDVHKKKADVLRHFKKDPDNLAIAWEQYQSEYLNRYETTQILLTNGVQIEPEYQKRLIDNQRAITQSLPPEINLITAPVIPDSIGPMTSLGGIIKPLAITGTEETGQQIEARTAAQTAARTAATPIIKTEDGRTYQTYKKPEIENPATPEQMAEMRERIKAFAQGGRMGQHKPVVELTEEAIELEKQAKKANYLANLNEMLQDPILRKEAMKEAFNREDLEFLCDEEGTPYQVIYAEP